MVIIDGRKISGHLTGRRCARCAERLVFSDRWDADFYPACNALIDAECGDPGCAQCRLTRG